MSIRNRVTRSLLGACLALAFGTAASAADAAPRVVKLKGTDAMQYDVKMITAKPGEKLKVQLSTVSAMAKEQMSHNFVLLAKTAPVDQFVMEASMARDKGYIPDSGKKHILAATKLAGNGETVEVVFDAPKEPGEYLYICTFPGHYMAGMKGKLIVK
jgi:azurin